MGVSKNNGTPKSSILIGLSIIFTIHFGGKIPLFLEGHPYLCLADPEKAQWLRCVLVKRGRFQQEVLRFQQTTDKTYQHLQRGGN